MKSFKVINDETKEIYEITEHDVTEVITALEKQGYGRPAKMLYVLFSSLSEERDFMGIGEGFRKYQNQASKTARYPDRSNLMGLLYTALGLAGEAGEIANKVKKILRDESGNLTPETYNKLQEELGDVLWYASQLSWEIKYDFGDVAINNLYKLRNRLEQNKIKGEGDER